MSNRASCHDKSYMREKIREIFFNNFLCARPVITLPISKPVAQKKSSLITQSDRTTFHECTGDDKSDRKTRNWPFHDQSDH